MAASVALVAGVGIGTATTAIAFRGRPWRLGDFTIASPAKGSGRAVAETPETTHRFGAIGTGEEGSHEFTIRSVGGAPLEVRRGATSCTCTLSGFEGAGVSGDGTTATVQPGDTLRVRVAWKGKGAGGPFRQQATIITNDPRRPEIFLVIEGTVVPTWKASPDAFTFARLSANAGGTAEVRIYTYGSTSTELASLTIDPPDPAGVFSLSSAALDPADVAAEPGATGGRLLTLRIGPGLPLGPLRRTVTAMFGATNGIKAEMAVLGTVTGDLALAGPGWDSLGQTLVLGTVSARTGLRTRLFLTARGPHSGDVKPVVREVVPTVMQVTIGETVAVGGGTAVRTPIDIVIPPGSSPANHLCSDQAPAGRIVIDTGHPDSPSLPIRVCVAIGP